MAEYIKREEAIKRIQKTYCVDCNSYNGVRCRACGTGDAIDMIEDAPAADVAPVVHGRWICEWDTDLGITTVICSRCKDAREVRGCYVSTGGEGMYDEDAYCPNCGAKMDGGDSE